MRGGCEVDAAAEGEQKGDCGRKGGHGCQRSSAVRTLQSARVKDDGRALRSEGLAPNLYSGERGEHRSYFLVATAYLLCPRLQPRCSLSFRTLCSAP